MLGSIVSIQHGQLGPMLTLLAGSFRILITGDNSGLVETITDAVSIHSIKKAEYARRMTSGALGNVSLLDHFVNVSHPAFGARVAGAESACRPTAPWTRVALPERSATLSNRLQATASSRTSCKSRIGITETSWSTATAISSTLISDSC